MQKCKCMKKDCAQPMQGLWGKKLLCPLKGNGILCGVQSLAILLYLFYLLNNEKGELAGVPVHCWVKLFTIFSSMM